VAILSSEFIPKERLSAYQRWELATLEEPEEPRPPEDTAAVALDALREEARAAGHAEGHAQGFALAAGERVRFAALVDAIGSEVAGREQELAEAVVALALSLARKIVDVSTTLHRESLLPIVTAALEQLPQGPRRIRLCANPADVEIVRGMFANELGAQQWQIHPDPSISEGGFRVETDQCEIDATLETRWGRLMASLGRAPDDKHLSSEHRGSADEPGNAQR